MATGCLSDRAGARRSRGSRRFAGRWYHTGRWPHEGVDFTGQRVGVIGTGSSAIQSIPIIAEQAAHLIVFQRTPNFSVPARNAPLDPEYERRGQGELRRASGAQARESRVGFVVPSAATTRRWRCPTEERRREYEARWQPRRPRLHRRVRRPADRPGGQRHRRRVRPRQDPRDRPRPGGRRDAGAARTIRSAPSASASTPTTTRRSTATTSRWSTCDATPIEAITPRRACARRDAEYELDSIVFATGFDAMTGALLGIDIRGRGGAHAAATQWADGPAHLPRPRRRRLPEPVHDHRARAARRCSAT